MKINYQNFNSRTLMIDKQYVIKRSKKSVTIRNIIISNQIYDEKIARFLVDFIFKKLSSFRFEKKVVFNKNNEY